MNQIHNVGRSWCHEGRQARGRDGGHPSRRRRLGRASPGVTRASEGQDVKLDEQGMSSDAAQRTAGSPARQASGAARQSSGAAQQSSGTARQSRGAARYRLTMRPILSASAPALDEDQQAVVAHRGGPLLVLAGPGTGKTTTLVEAVVNRIEQDHLTPGEVLVLTFSRKAAAELRERITARLGFTSVGPSAATFHSFCYALVRQYQPAAAFIEPLRLLSAPEQEVVVRDLLAGSVDTGRIAWPALVRNCLLTRGLAAEMRDVIARTRSLAMDPGDLVHMAKAADDAEAMAHIDEETWGAVAEFIEDYLDVLDSQGAIDYSELIHRAVLLAERPDVRRELRERFAAVFVDEYQDTDPAQVRLLRALAGDGKDLIVVGDPDQSIYAFRGADVRGILDFPSTFRQADGSPAPVRVLSVSRRAGGTLLTASRRIAERLPLSQLPASAVRKHRGLRAADGVAAGSLEVYTYPSLGAELDGIADLLRRAHLEDGIRWRDMAVLVRSGRRSIAIIRRVLGAAGVPVDVAGDELPLPEEPAVAPLLLALRCAADPTALTPEVARALLLSPLAGADAGDVRRLGRALRAEERLAAAARGQPLAAVRPSAHLIRDAVANPEILTTIDDIVAAPARRLGALLGTARDILTAGGAADEALWSIWAGTSWPRRLLKQSEQGGQAGQRAHRDLDAICELFHAAERAEERAGHRGALNFIAEIEAQQIPADTLAEQGVRGEGVRLLTAHRSKGLEWRLVVVTGVQEHVWPDLRRRGSLLQSDRIRPDGLTAVPSLASILAEERRLFYVAITRARERLVVTAVRSPQDDGDQPSRFLDELAVTPVAVDQRPSRPMTLSGLVAELRAAAVDPDASQALRDAAARRLARLAAATDDIGRPLVPAAHPSRWWGLAEISQSTVPVRDPNEPVRLSPSAVETLHDCPLKWFLRREARADTARTGALGFGSVVHALAAEVGDGVTPAELDALIERLDRVWAQLSFEAAWQSEQQREEARAALARFLAWHLQARGRAYVAGEHAFDVTVSLGDGKTPVRLTGRMDRVERDSEGRAWIVDFKTGKTVPPDKDIERHPQLGVYQLAVEAGALDGLAGFGGQRPQPGGAELVQLRRDAPRARRDNGDDAPVPPKVQPQPVPDRDADGATWVERIVLDAALRVMGERFQPQPSEDCDRCEFRRACPARPEGRQVVE